MESSWAIDLGYADEEIVRSNRKRWERWRRRMGKLRRKGGKGS